MTILRDLSVLWSLLHTLIIFTIFCRPKYTVKKTVILTFLFMLPLLIYNFLFFLHFGPLKTGQMILLNCSLPSMMFFYFLSSYKDGRFFFTFCFVDTLAIEIIYVTHLLNYYLPGDHYLVMFILRLIAFPLMEWAILKWLKKPYHDLQESIQKGWGSFACISVLFYLLLVLLCNFPTLVTNRPVYLPSVILLLLLMPFMYWCIFLTLFRQQKIYQMREYENLLRLQSEMIQKRIDEAAHSKQMLDIERHDMRHRFQILDAMLMQGDIDQARSYIASSDQILSNTNGKHWCRHPVLDAVFSSYFQLAEKQEIRIEAELDIPKDIPFDSVELSTVFGNALENAIQAVSKLPVKDRVIKCKCIHHPQLMFRISNPYTGTVLFDDHARPVSRQKGHGIGTRSIAAYCEKHNAFCNYKVENGWFTMQIIQAE